MDNPTKPDLTQWLAETTVGKDVVLAEYDHTTDNYEIKVNGSMVWGSNGNNRHDLAEAVFEAVVNTIHET